MSRRSNRLIFLILTLTALSLYWGCSQPKDVISDVTSSRLTLIAERLPTLPSGMVYELWVSEANGEATSLGKFSYDHVNRVFLEAFYTTPRSNEFTLEDDLLKQYWDEDDEEWKYWFTSVFVSVETIPDGSRTGHGPIMLQDFVTEPSEDQIELRFQTRDEAIGEAMVLYNMESVSDGNSSSASVGQGLWFAAYRQDTKYLPDTTGCTVTFTPDEIGDLETEIIYDTLGDSIGVDTLNGDEIFIWSYYQVSDSGQELDTITFGSDTVYLGSTPLLHTGFRVELDSQIDSLAPYMWNEVHFVYDTVVRNVTLDIFTQDEWGLPDYGPDWLYKGWIVSSTARTASTGTLLHSFIKDRFTPPAWTYNTPTHELIPGDTGVLLPTGTFRNMDQPDDANPFVLDPLLVPPYPGEDFVDAAALGVAYGKAEVFDLLPNGFVNSGTVLITLEPSNFNSSTNFPLIAFGKRLPSSKAFVSGDEVGIDMWNWTQTLETSPIGLPQITIEIERF